MNLLLAFAALEQMAKLAGVTTKSVDEIVAEYDDMLTKAARIGFRNQTNEREISLAHKDMLRALAPQVYFEGMLQGGVEQTEADDDDRQAIADWIADQSQYTLGLAQAIMDAKKDKPLQEQVYARIDKWLLALRALGAQGYASAQGNAMGTWKYGETEHCDTCRALNNQRKRLKTWVKQGLIPQQPGSVTLDCGGWNCLCKIVDDKGNQLLPA